MYDSLGGCPATYQLLDGSGSPLANGANWNLDASTGSLKYNADVLFTQQFKIKVTRTAIDTISNAFSIGTVCGNPAWKTMFPISMVNDPAGGSRNILNVKQKLVDLSLNPPCSTTISIGSGNTGGQLAIDGDILKVNDMS